MNKREFCPIQDLLYDWGSYDFAGREISVFDTTLRDGLQSPQIQKQPSIKEKILFLESASELGIDAIEIGFPAASERHKQDVIKLAKHAQKTKMPILLSCLARTTKSDIEAVAEVSQKSGVQIIANILIGSSKLRQLVENWNIKQMVTWIEESIKLSHRNNLDVEFVTEDTTRTDPETNSILYKTAIQNGVKRVWVADTVGTASPNSAKKITKYFVEKIIAGSNVGLDWHGHNDKGLGTANALAAAEAGADRIQATALGTGERAGNTAMEPVVISLSLEGINKYNLTKLEKYSSQASTMFDIPISGSYPGIGKYVHSTAAGMHAAAINKARKMKREDIEGIVYAPFSPTIFNRKSVILIGPMSGKANVELVADKLGLSVNEAQGKKILQKAKNENRFITINEVKSYLNQKF